MEYPKTSKRFIVSLILILVSFVLLVGIAFKSLLFQQEMLSRQNRAEKLSRIDQISEEYFRRLETSPLPAEAIPLPMSNPSLPALAAPDSALARNIFMKISMGAGSKQALLIEGELNSSPDEQDFWRYLQMNEYAATGNHFEMRRCAFQILNSNFDYLLDNGRTLKTEAAIKVAEAFLAENNPESCRQWLLRLRALPVPVAIPQSSKQMLKGELPPQLLAWLNFLIHCYQLSYAEPIESGWKQSQTAETLVIKHTDGIAAFSASTVLAGFTGLLRQRGFSKVVIARSPGMQGNSHLLAGSRGLWVTIDVTEPPAPFPGGFVLLLILTSAGILGLFWFSLHEWQFIQKARLLEEEEDFFRQTAHDLKTPITNVSFLAETLALKRYRSEEQQSRYLSQLQVETSKAAELFDRLLLSVRLRRKTV
ncbi:MAG TPA: histidine kinase dimerization/phospho-acceptor domain-containing protein, partial [Candidatus Rifleibacterium sp.]|nr:histidine kinase dimerization/phospho-acceptor domain-containing protein [Candidatus Rifleibacterium sp.]